MSGAFDVAGKPNSGIGTESKLVDHLVSPVIDIPEMYWVVSSRPISIRILHIRASKVKAAASEGCH